MAEVTITDLLIDLDVQIDELRETHGHLRKTADGVIKQMNEVESRLKELMAVKAVTSSIEERLRRRQSPRHASPPRPTIAEAAVAELVRLGGEAEMSALVEALSARGVLTGKEQRATLSTQLLRHPEQFRRVGPGRWALTGTAPVPAMRSGSSLMTLGRLMSPAAPLNASVEPFVT
jgi:hypothetical protein